MRTTEEIENDLIHEIAKSDIEVLQNLWLEYQDTKNANAAKFAARIEAKGPVIIGAAIGAIIGHLFSPDKL